MTKTTIYVSPEICTETGPVDGYLVVEAGRIAALGPGPVPPSLAGLPAVHEPGSRIIPGMIDLHIHGAGGWVVEHGRADHLQALSRYLAAHATTGWYPTCATAPFARMEAAVVAVRDAMAEPGDGARILGCHLEGPYLNPKQKGAMDPRLFRTPDLAEVEHLLELGGGTVRRVTIAPELPGAPGVIAALAAAGVMVAGGHTDATYPETVIGIEAGIRTANHTYNAMRGLHHREPGALAAYLVDPRIMCEVICDLLHVHPAALRLLLNAAGSDRVAVISDAIAAAGLPPGRYHLFGHEVTIDQEGFSRLPGGTIAGSTRLMLAGLRNLVETVGVPLADACRLAALNPARIAGLDARKGSLAVGKDADLVVLDAGWQVRWTVVEGLAVRRPGDPPPPINPDFLSARLS